MSEITLKAIEQLFDKRLSGIPTKADLKSELQNTEQRIIKRIDEAQEELARIIADTVAVPFTERLDRLEKLLQVEHDVETLKRDVLEIRTALHLGM